MNEESGELNNGDVVDSLKRSSEQKTFLLLSLGIYVFYGIAGYCQEYLFRIPGFKFGLFLTFIEFFVFYLLSTLQSSSYFPFFKYSKRRRLSGQSSTLVFNDIESQGSISSPDIMKKYSRPPHHPSHFHSRLYHFVTSNSISEFLKKPNYYLSPSIPLYFPIIVSIFEIASRSLSASSLRFISFPTKIVIKSSKLVVIMLVGLVILRKSYPASKYVISFTVVLGLIFFTLGDYRVSHPLNPLSPVFASELEQQQEQEEQWRLVSNQIKGTVCLLFSIILEAIYVNIQKKAMEGYQVSTLELVRSTSVFGTVVLAVVNVLVGEWSVAVDFCVQNGTVILWSVVFSVCCYGGVMCALEISDSYDPTTTALVTTTRKLVTIVGSFVLFPKPLTIMHVMGTVLIFAAILLERYFLVTK